MCPKVSIWRKGNAGMPVEKGLRFNYCENRARHPVSTTSFCKNNRLNIYKHFNFEWLFNIWGCRGLIYLTKNGSENIIYARKYRSIARWRSVNLSCNICRKRSPYKDGGSHRRQTAVNLWDKMIGGSQGGSSYLPLEVSVRRRRCATPPDGGGRRHRRRRPTAGCRPER